jgi:hypothetical protein
MTPHTVCEGCFLNTKARRELEDTKKHEEGTKEHEEAENTETVKHLRPMA